MLKREIENRAVFFDEFGGDFAAVPAVKTEHNALPEPVCVGGIAVSRFGIVDDIQKPLPRFGAVGLVSDPGLAAARKRIVKNAVLFVLPEFTA